MNIPTLLRLVVPAAEGQENEDAAKPAAVRPAPARSSVGPEAREKVSPPTADRLREKSAPRSLPPLAPPQPKAGGAYQFGRRPEEIQEKAIASVQPARELPSLTSVKAKYPHVLAKIRATWRDPGAFEELMRELLLQERSGRAGFDPDALMELTRLHEYYALAVARADNGLDQPSYPAP